MKFVPQIGITSAIVKNLLFRRNLHINFVQKTYMRTSKNDNNSFLNPSRFENIKMPKFYSSDGLEVCKKMYDNCIVPDVISEAPKGLAIVKYPSGAEVNLGRELRPMAVKNEPIVTWNSEKNTYYTVAMVDPDAPSRKKPQYREWLHWLVGNIECNEVKKGCVLAEYIGAGPPECTGLHRYVILVFKQKGKLTFDEKKLKNNSADNRGKFKIQNFAKKYKMSEILAGNFFTAEWDTYVPILNKKLGL